MRVRSAGAEPRAGFGLLVALLAIIVIVMLAAVAVTPNMVTRIDSVRVSTARSILSALTEGDQQIVAFNTELGTYPRLLSHLSAPITATDSDLCGKTYTNADVTSWRPYLDRVVPTSGMPVSIGVAQNTLTRQDIDNTTALLIVNIPGVAVEDAEALDRQADPSPSSTAGKAQWGAASSEGLVTLQWMMEIPACPGGGGRRRRRRKEHRADLVVRLRLHGPGVQLHGREQRPRRQHRRVELDFRRRDGHLDCAAPDVHVRGGRYVHGHAHGHR